MSGALVDEIAVDLQLTDYAVSTVLHQCEVVVGHQRLSADEIEQASDLYLSGLSITDTAAKMDRAYSSIQKVLSEAGVELRPPTRRNKLGLEQVEQATACYLHGDSLLTIGQLFGVSAETARLALTRAGVTMRPVGHQAGHGHGQLHPEPQHEGSGQLSGISMIGSDTPHHDVVPTRPRRAGPRGLRPRRAGPAGANLPPPL